MEGWLPEDKDKEYSLSWAKKLHQDYWASRGEQKRPDAYIYTIGGKAYLKFWDSADRMVLSGDLDEAYQYNIISKDVFKARYPDTLKFKEWEVKEEGEMYVKVGCERVYKPHIDGFCKVAMLANTHKVDLKDLYVFLYTNKEKLGLLF